VALEEMLEERFQAKGTLNRFIYFADFVMSEFFPTGANRSVVAQAVEKEFDLAEGEAHVAGEANEKRAVEGIAGIAALAAGAVRRGEQAHFFVVAEGGGVKTGADSEFPDFHFSLPGISLDLKLTLTSSIRGWDVANPNWRKTMSGKKNRFVEASWQIAAKWAVALFLVSGGAAGLLAQSSAIAVRPERQAATMQSRFYCNTKALNPTERARHKQLSEKLAAQRKEIVETEKGYEFQFSPADISLAQLAEWVAAESKCCPFFDFHIDLEREGKLLCLRLTGEEGIKAFIRAEFKVDAVK
jgi:hypothetical protein